MATKTIKVFSKPEIVAKVAEKSGLNRYNAEAALNATLDSIIAALKVGDSVQFVGFGTFEVRERQARTGVNLHTKQKIEIPAKKVVGFKAGKTLKESVEG